MFPSPFNVYYNLRVKSEADKLAKKQNETIFKNTKSAMVKSYMFGAARAHEHSIEYENNENENEGFIFMSTNKEEIKKHLYESPKFKKLYGANLDYVYTDPGLKKEDRVSLRSSNFSKILQNINKDEYQEFYTDNSDKITYRRNKPEKSEYFLKKDIYSGLEKKLGINSEEKLENFIFGPKPKVEKQPVEERRIVRAKPKLKGINTGLIIEELPGENIISESEKRVEKMDDFLNDPFIANLHTPRETRELIETIKDIEKEEIVTTLPKVPTIFTPSKTTEDIITRKYINPLDKELANIKEEGSPFTFAESNTEKEKESKEREKQLLAFYKENPQLDPGNQPLEKLSKDDLN